jgi:hypothetical protein
MENENESESSFEISNALICQNENNETQASNVSQKEILNEPPNIGQQKLSHLSPHDELHSEVYSKPISPWIIRDNEKVAIL